MYILRGGGTPRKFFLRLSSAISPLFVSVSVSAAVTVTHTQLAKRSFDEILDLVAEGFLFLMKRIFICNSLCSCDRDCNFIKTPTLNPSTAMERPSFLGCYK